MQSLRSPIIHSKLASTSTGRHPLKRLVTSLSVKFRSSRRIFFGHPEFGMHLGLSFFSRFVNRFTFSAKQKKTEQINKQRDSAVPLLSSRTQNKKTSKPGVRGGSTSDPGHIVPARRGGSALTHKKEKEEKLGSMPDHVLVEVAPRRTNRKRCLRASD